MKHMDGRRLISLFLCLLLFSGVMAFTACGKAKDSGDAEYEAQKITISGEKEGEKEITIAELRELPQHQLDASYKRTTGLLEEFKMEGPYLSDVFDSLGLKLEDYAAIGVQGTDGYYCLIPQEVIEATPDMMLAVVVDGKAKLSKKEAPARLAVQGQFGPYWVKKIDKITLFTEIKPKVISSVWVFDNLAQGIEPYQYEYYGSKDDAIELEQIFSRFDQVDGSAFFTMKSSDGFEKNEALNMVKSRYYIKVTGEDAPTNISPHIKLGMNVKNISWISTNADAAIFPQELAKYMDQKTVNGKKGLPLSEVLFEVGVEKVEGVQFDLLGTAGEKATVSGSALKNCILCTNEDGTYGVVSSETEQANIANLMRVRVSENQPAEKEKSAEEKKQEEEKGTTAGAVSKGKDAESKKHTNATQNVVLTIRGNGVEQTTTWSLDDLKGLTEAKGVSYSMVNNWPTRKFFAGRGVPVKKLLQEAGIKSNAASIKVIATDGYYAQLTKNQLLNDGNYYPNIQKASAAGAAKVPAILAWACNEESASVKEVTNCPLRLLVGQRGVNDVNTDVAVKNVNVIEVSTAASGSWPAPQAFPDPGTVAAGTEISFNYDNMDQVKIYYTTDGSNPTMNSPVYNPSTSYFQPELTKPLVINQTTSLKVLVAGWGKNDSAITTYQYVVE